MKKLVKNLINVGSVALSEQAFYSKTCQKNGNKAEQALKTVVYNLVTIVGCVKEIIKVYRVFFPRKSIRKKIQ